jgi:glycosyltransferase involved in cell wall biosynthesis
MAAGVPVVAAGAGGPAEIVEHRVTGLLYPPGDVAALADALHRLAEDDSLRQRLADAGQARARSYSPDAVAARVRAVYEEVLAP